MRISGFNDPELRQATCRIERFREETAQKQKVTVKLAPGQEDILMTRISTENRALRDRLEKEAKEKGVEYRVISSKLPTDLPQPSEAIYIVKASDYTQYGPLLVKLVDEIEHPKTQEPQHQVREEKVTFLAKDDNGDHHPVEIIRLSWEGDVSKEAKEFQKRRYPAHTELSLFSKDDMLILVPRKCSRVELTDIQPKIEEYLEVEEGAPSTKDLHLLTLENEEEISYVNISEKGEQIGIGSKTAVFAQQQYQEKKANPLSKAEIKPGFVASFHGKTPQEIEAINHIWSALEKLVGKEHLSKIVGIQPPFLTDKPEILSKYYPQDLHLLVEKGTLKQEKKGQYALQLLEALFWMQYINSLNLDIKLQNILVGDEGVIVIDHPDAPLLSEVQNVQEAKIVEKYLQNFATSPEYVDMDLYLEIRRRVNTPRNESDGDLIKRVNGALILVPKFQSFGMGSVLYALLVGQLPYPMKKIAQGRIPNMDRARAVDPRDLLNELKGKCPHKMGEFIVKMISPDPNQRPTLTDLSLALTELDPKFVDVLSKIRD